MDMIGDGHVLTILSILLMWTVVLAAMCAI